MASAPRRPRKSGGEKTMLLNVGGAGLLVLGAYLAIMPYFEEAPQTPPCDTRYSGGVLFSYSRAGQGPLATEDLQARLAGTDRGLIKNAAIVEDPAVPNGYALEVSLKRSSADEDDQSRSGIGFVWVPRQLSLATAACLTYNVFIPENFKLGDGGTLPGLVSVQPPSGETAPPAASDQSDASELKPFSVRAQWRSDGALMVSSRPNVGPQGTIALDPQKGGLKRGKWVRIEQEAELNTPNRQDGKLRIWVDGKLLFEQLSVGFRRDEIQSFQAIIGDIHHIRDGGWAPAPSDSKLRISPLELRLR